MNSSASEHWDTVYKIKEPGQVSWSQEVPETSLAFIHSFGLAKSARIIDVGGGDSTLVDFLLADGFENITVLDISALALEKAKKRLGDKAEKINWIVSDILTYQPDKRFDVWHDRASFHFLTIGDQVGKYVDTARKAVSGYLIIGSFSDKGPDKCSGLVTLQYSEEKLIAVLRNGFDKLGCITEDHITPLGTKQNFLYCSFKRHLN